MNNGNFFMLVTNFYIEILLDLAKGCCLVVVEKLTAGKALETRVTLRSLVHLQFNSSISLWVHKESWRGAFVSQTKH